MSKQKTLLLNSIIGILGVIALLLTFQFAGFTRVKAASELVGHEQDALKFENLTWTKTASGKQYVFDMFTGSEDGKNYVKYFKCVTYNDTGNKTWGTHNNSSYSSNENKYQYLKREASKTSPKNGYIQNNFEISNALKTAMQNGFLSLSAYAEFGTFKQKYYVGMTGEDQADTVVMTFAGQSATHSGSFGTTTKTMTTTNASNSFSLKFEVTLNAKNINATTMSVKNPTITLSTTDTTAPTITLQSVTNADTWSQKKTVTYIVEDSQAGVNSIVVKANGTAITPTIKYENNTKKATVTFDVNKNDVNYTIFATDNVGNSGSGESYTSKFIDTTSPSVSFDFAENQLFENLNVSFSVTIADTTQASEEFWYTFDGTDPASSGTRLPLSNGTNKFLVSEEKDYTIKIYGVDSAGNSISISRNIIVQQQYYDYSITKIYFDRNETIASGTQVLSGTAIELDTSDFTQNGLNFQFYRATLNNTETAISSYITLRENLDIKLYFRQIVEVEFTKLNYDSTGAQIQYEYNANCDDAILNFKVLQNGTATTFDSAGEYTIAWAVNDTEKYIGSGQQQLTILNAIEVKINNTAYTFDSNSFKFDFDTDTEEYSLVFKNANGEEFDEATVRQNGLDVGEYTYILTFNNENDYIKDAEFGTRSISGTFTVSPKQIDLGEFNESTIYNGTTYEFTQKYSYTTNVQYKLQSEDDSAYTTTAPKNAGVYDVLVTIIQPNYTGSMLGQLTILPKSLKIIADNKQSIYGEELQELTYTIDSKNGFVAEENYTFNLTSDADKSKAGDYAIIIEEPVDVTLLANYDLTLSNGTYTVSRRPVVVSVKSGQSKIFGENDPETLIFNVENLLSGDDLGISLVREAGENVGSYKTTIKDKSTLNPNYEIIEFISNNFVIKSCSVVVVINPVSKVYGEEITANDFDFKIYGNANKQDLGVTLVRADSENTNVGKYLISAIINENSNYDIEVINNYLTISPKEIIVTANTGQSKFYGDSDPILTYTISEENILLNGSLSRVRGERVGNNYAITMGTLNNSNYNITFVSATFEIKKAQIVITAKDTTKTYGDIEPEFSWTVDKIINLDEITSGSLMRTAGENVGEYDIIENEKFASENYDIIFKKGIFTITPKTAYIMLTNQNKVYGSIDPKFNFKLLKVEDADIENITNSVVVSREEGEAVGEYSITAICENTNYNFKVRNATLNIIKADTTLSLDDSIFVYNTKAQYPTATLDIDGSIIYEIKQNGETMESGAIDAGEYQVIAKFAGDKNHNATSVTANLTIKKADVEVIIYKDIFVMKKDASIQDPVIGCALAESEYTIKFDDTTTAGNEGKHAYTIIFTNTNYNPIRGSVQILPIPTSSTTGGSAEFEDGNVDNENVDLVIEKTNDKEKAQSATDMVVDSTYQIKYNQKGNAQVKVELDYDASSYDNVYVYVYNDKGEAKMLPYQVVNGKIVFSIDADNVKFAIVRQVAGISIVTIGALLLLSGFITLGVVRNRKKKKIARILRVS